MNNYKTVRNPFKVEDYRNYLAASRQYSKLIKTYNKNYAEIKDINTSIFWDKLNINCKDYEDNINFMAKDRVAKAAKVIKGKELIVLNIGFGSANLEKYIFKHNNISISKWIGVDISYKSVVNARKHFPKAIFKLGNIKNINLSNNIFDYVITLEVLEHIPPHMILNALKEVNRVMKKNGIYIISVPLNEKLEQQVNNGFNPNGHVRVYTPALIKAELSLSGFDIVNEQYLYAFKTLYSIKTFVCKYILKNFRQPNNILLIAQKK